MHRSAIRAASRRINTPRIVAQNSAYKRSLSTAPPAKKSRSWKNSALRWGLAAGGIYYYNTSNVFAEEPEAATQRLDQSIHHIQESDQPTIDAIVEEKHRREAQRIADENKKEVAAKAALVTQEAAASEGEGGELGGLEEEADQQGAFNPETGEINWECPCLGGMAHGPCGEEFKAAFSCFVYSNEEPKGVECIDKFKGMQDCFRLHPETYASEFEDDEEEAELELRERERGSSSSEPAKASPEATTSSNAVSEKVVPQSTDRVSAEQPRQDEPKAAVETAQTPEKDSHNGDKPQEVLPKSAHDARS